MVINFNKNVFHFSVSSSTVIKSVVTLIEELSPVTIICSPGDRFSNLKVSSAEIVAFCKGCQNQVNYLKVRIQYLPIYLPACPDVTSGQAGIYIACLPRISIYFHIFLCISIIYPLYIYYISMYIHCISIYFYAFLSYIHCISMYFY